MTSQRFNITETHGIGARVDWRATSVVSLSTLNRRIAGLRQRGWAGAYGTFRDVRGVDGARVVTATYYYGGVENERTLVIGPVR